MSLLAELNLTRRMGAEYEMTIPLLGTGNGRDVQNSLAKILTDNGIRAVARDYSHQPVPEGIDICVERDSSIRGETRYHGISWIPVEVMTRILAGPTDWESVVPRTLANCRYMGARVNSSCGHHLHVEFLEAREQPTKIRSLFNLIHRFEPLILAILPPSRRNNDYCRPIPPSSARMLHGCRSLRCFERALSGWIRTSGLNLNHCFESSPRVEFRYAAGTLDSLKSRHWMRFLNRLMEHAVTRNCQGGTQQVAPSLAAWDSFCFTVGMRVNHGIYEKISPELRETAKFLRKRLKELSPELCGISGDESSNSSRSEED
jgi:hypothetical protein